MKAVEERAVADAIAKRTGNAQPIVGTNLWELNEPDRRHA